MPNNLSADGLRLYHSLRAEGRTAIASLRFARAFAAPVHVPQACTGPRGYADWSRRDSGAVW